MNQMNQEEALVMLRRLGFSAQEIDRLSRLRRVYAKKSEMDQATLDLRHLEFVRWLVQTGKLPEPARLNRVLLEQGRGLRRPFSLARAILVITRSRRYGLPPGSRSSRLPNVTFL